MLAEREVSSVGAYLDISTPGLSLGHAVKKKQFPLRNICDAKYPMTNDTRTVDWDNPYILGPE